MFHKILCATDFSPGSQQATKAAVRIAEAHAAELVLTHVRHLPALAFAGEQPFAPHVIQLMTEDEERGLAAALQEAQALGARRARTQLVSGLPADQIVESLRAEAAYDLAVVGTQGRSGVGRLLLGSVAERVIRHAPCSVLVVRAPAAQASFDRVLCPIDFSECSRHAVSLAAVMAAPRGAGITLLHAIEVPVTYSGAPSVGDFVENLYDHATQVLAAWAAELRAKVEVPVTTRLEIGHPGAEILKVVEEAPPFELVVVGSHGRTGVRRLWYGSVAEKVARHASCSVLVTRVRSS
ncbi:MAG: universal stress protein [Myxococcota bacterium]|nr:universal stress protein [Myxococcota bacterium]